MKLLLLTFSLLICCHVIFSQSKGELTVSTSTSDAGGRYKPKNAVVIWIEDSSGSFIKTLLVNSNKRQKHLNTWEASTTKAGSVYNKVDAISGASNTTHGTRTCSWDGTDFNKKEVNDGTYKVCMELTDKNATGNYSTFTFNKGAEKVELSPSDKPSFSAISINWTPSDNTSIKTSEADKNFRVYPNPGNGLFTIQGESLVETEVLSISGQLITRTKQKVIDLNGRPNGIYLFKIKSDNREELHKVLIQ